MYSYSRTSRYDGKPYSSEDVLRLGRDEQLNKLVGIARYTTEFNETNGPIANVGVFSAYDHTTPIAFDGFNHLTQNLARRQGGRQTHSHLFYEGSTAATHSPGDILTPIAEDPYSFPPRRGDGSLSYEATSTPLLSRKDNLLFGSQYLQNEVLDTNKNQGTFDIYDLNSQTRRDLSHRTITVENSSAENDIKVAIFPTLRYAYDDPEVPILSENGEDLDIGARFPKSFLTSGIAKIVTIPAREQKALDINAIDTRHQQSAVVISLEKEDGYYTVLSSPTVLKRTANSFVLRDGVNFWWFEFMKYSR